MLDGLHLGVFYMDLEQKIIYQQNMLIELEDQLFQQRQLQEQIKTTQEQLQFLLAQQRQLQEEVDAKINQLHYEVEATRALISNM